ncbi:TonB-dependent receptor [Sphingomonas sp. BT-65]|uniref:TonB-dependent receptor n=1 Tax=Sphingomonas sp. BT-65 TaxID=2989821 RepID=UPI0022355A3A|nr:TonB-dependent receptor [Sphingomonas sp. BT-65]MCW4460710.1 TonB-dependent receptor [Sphingomonas sp. BT-65]
MPALAQEAESEDVVITAQRDNQTQVSRNGSLGALGDKDAMDTPFAVKSYNEALILNQQPLTLGAVLENDPSVRTTLGFGNMSEQFVVRGFNLFGEDIAIDGLFGITPRQLVSPELYDQIQILNGASAFLFGAAPGGSALGGTVNLTPKRAKDQDTNRLTVNYLSDKHFGGAFDFGRRFGEGKAFGARINGAFRSGDIAIDDEFRRSAVVGGSFDYRTDNLRVSLDLAYQNVKAQHMRPMVQLNNAFGTATTLPRVPRADINYGQSWYNQTIRDVFGIVKLEYDVTDNLIFYASAGARDTAERGVYQGFQVTNSATGAAFVTGSNIPRNDNNEAAQAGLRFKGEGWGITHQLNMGYSHSRYVNRNAFEFSTSVPATSPQNNLYNPVQVARPAFNGFISGNLADPNPANRTRLDSIFVSDTLGFAEDVVQLTLGLRHQSIHFRAYNINTNVQTSQYKESTTTPVVGLVIRPSENISLYANRIEGLAQGPVAGAGTLNVGQVFPPFQTVQYEIGGKVQFGRFNASIAGFQTDRPQGINVPTPPGVTPAGTIFTVDGLQRNKGIEVSVDGEPIDGLRIIAGFSVTDAKQRRTQGGLNDGRDAVGVPEYTANANVEWDVYGGLTLTGRVMQTGKQAFNVTNTIILPEWTRFDLGARYVIDAGGAPLTFRFNVDNVANERYWASSLGGYLVQGMPRTFKASATIDF